MKLESECRRPEFTEGCKVKLGDGQEWTFPKPVLRLVPVRREAGGFEMRGTPPFGPDYQAKLDRYVDSDADTEDAAVESFCLRVELAVDLLSRNYVLTDEDVQDLFYIASGGTEETTEMWKEIENAVLGRAPKPSAVG